MEKNNIINFINEILQAISNLTYSGGKDQVLKIGEVKNPEIITAYKAEEIASSTISIVNKLYGESHLQVKDFLKKLEDSKRATAPTIAVIQLCYAKLSALKKDIQYGLLKSIDKEISSEIFSDFINSAKEALKGEFVNVAAVLGCAALEDSLKRLAKVNDLDVEGKSMQDVVNILKVNGILKGAQSKLMNSYVTLRNRTFHADWGKVESTDVSSLIAFTEQILLENFN